MTRPIYEPSPARTDAYLDFQQQQLFRRPAPTSGGDSGAYPYIFRQINPADDNQTQIVPNNGAGVIVDFSGNTLGTGATVTDQWGDGGEDFFEVYTLDEKSIEMTLPTQRRCYFTGQVKWDDEWAGGTTFRWHSGAWGWYKSLHWNDPGGASGNGGDSPIMYFETRMPSGSSIISIQVEQWSGSDRYLASAWMEIGVINTFEGNPNDY